jgi:hypothetical protein
MILGTLKMMNPDIPQPPVDESPSTDETKVGTSFVEPSVINNKTTKILIWFSID